MGIDYSVVLDANEREKMLAEGYLPEVIDWHAQERYEKLQEDFRWKNAILKSHYEPTPYFEFVGEVFPDLEKLMVVTAETGYKEMDVDELMEYQAQRDDVYVVPASFINGYNKASACQDVYALVVDIDRIKPETLQVIIENGNLGGMTPMPTYIVNSGRGVHFYYVFQEPVPHYHGNRKVLKEMYNILCGITGKNINAKTDWHAITQPFRLPGSLTRLGQTVTGWNSGSKWPAKTLARRLGVDGDALDLQRRPLLDQRKYQEEKARRQALRASQGEKTGKKRIPFEEWESSLSGNTGFYLGCLQRCYNETPEGTRYWSMCALVTVAFKCDYPKDQLEKDLLQLLEHYNAIGGLMKTKELEKALKMYKPKALMTRSTTLESWFGWKFRRDREKLNENRKPRSQKEHLKRARLLQTLDYPNGEWRNREGAPTKEQVVRSWRAEYPEGKPKDCIQATGLSKNTVYKWWNTKGE